LVKGGMCEVLFGGGVFEFRPDRLVGMDANARGTEQELDRVEYRGDSKHVVVIPKTTIKLMEFDFEGPDRINWASQKCVLVRVKGAATSASTGAATAAAAAAAPAAVSKSTTPAASGERGGALNLSVGSPSADNKVAGRKLWVLKEDAQVALIKGGIKSTPDRSVLQNWMQACTARTADCQKGALALKPYSVGLATTDGDGSRAYTFTAAGPLLGAERRKRREQARHVEPARRREGRRQVAHAGRAKRDACRLIAKLVVSLLRGIVKRGLSGNDCRAGPRGVTSA
jgi:hypothetical protein